MSDTVRYPLVLGLISLCSAAGLALTYTLTREEIRRQDLLKVDRSLGEVFELKFDEQKPERPWQAADEAGSVFRAPDPMVAGAFVYAARSQVSGYGPEPIEIIVAVEGLRHKGDAATIKAVKVVKQSETPGLGDKCEKDGKFARQFEGLAESRLKLAKYIPYRDPGNDEQPIAAITGATITSKAVIGAIRDAIERVRKNVPDGTAKP